MVAITGFDPQQGAVDTPVTLTVTDLPAGTTLAQIAVTIGLNPITQVQLPSDTSILVTIPPTAETDYFVLKVTPGDLEAQSATEFTVLQDDKPTITNLTPRLAAPGQPVQISGNYLDQVSNVMLGPSPQINIPVFIKTSAYSIRMTLPFTLANGQYYVYVRAAGGAWVRSLMQLTVTAVPTPQLEPAPAAAPPGVTDTWQGPAPATPHPDITAAWQDLAPQVTAGLAPAALAATLPDIPIPAETGVCFTLNPPPNGGERHTLWEDQGQGTIQLTDLKITSLDGVSPQAAQFPSDTQVQLPINFTTLTLAGSYNLSQPCVQYDVDTNKKIGNEVYTGTGTVTQTAQQGQIIYQATIGADGTLTLASALVTGDQHLDVVPQDDGGGLIAILAKLLMGDPEQASVKGAINNIFTTMAFSTDLITLLNQQLQPSTPA
jgi:hypothetical protein